MKSFLLRAALSMVMLSGMTAQAGSLFQDRTGLSIRGGFWHSREKDSMVQIHANSLFQNEAHIGGAGGWITFISGFDERGCIEFSLGGMARVEAIEEGLFTEQVTVKAATGILVGYQYSIFENRNMNAFQPYVSAGGGPYVLTRVHSIQYNLLDDEVTINNKIRPGMYAGLGTYFSFTEWFALHGEMRYHLVNFNPDNHYSGFEIGLGFAFSWDR